MGRINRFGSLGPPRQRLGHVRVRGGMYDILIPADSGGEGANAWDRMQFTFQISQFNGSGVLHMIGERNRETVTSFPIQCEPPRAKPRGVTARRRQSRHALSDQT